PAVPPAALPGLTSPVPAGPALAPAPGAVPPALTPVPAEPGALAPGLPSLPGVTPLQAAPPAAPSATPAPRRGARPALPRIDLDLEDASIADAVKQVVERSGLGVEPVVAGDVAAETRLTVRAKTIRMAPALDLIAQVAGAGWRLEEKDGKRVLRLGRSLPAAAEGRFMPLAEPVIVPATPVEGGADSVRGLLRAA